MAYYKPTQNAEATYGEQSSSVLELQKRLNRDFNAGLAEDSKYGPLTLAAFQKYGAQQPAAPTAPVVAPVGANAGATESPYNTRNIDLSGINQKPQYQSAEELYRATYGVAPTFDEVYRSELDNMQSLIDSTNMAYGAMLKSEERKGENRSGMTRAIQARGGNLGSSFGTAAAEKTSQYNAEVENAIRAEQAAAIAGITSKARNLALGRFQDERASIEKKGDDFIAYQKEQQEGFRKDLGNIARQGISLDDLEDEEYKDLYTAGGFDNQLAFESFYNENLPKAEQPEYFLDETVKGKNGNAVQRRAYVDKNGQAQVKEYDLGFAYADIAPDAETKVIDGALYERQDDKTWKRVAGTPGGVKSATAKEDKGYGLSKDQTDTLVGVGISGNDIDNIQKDIDAVGLDAVLANESLNDAQRTAVKKIFSNKETEQFLDANYFRNLFDEKELKKSARKAGFGKMSGGGVYNVDTEGYLQSLESVVENYRRAGYTDQDILKEMEK